MVCKEHPKQRLSELKNSFVAGCVLANRLTENKKWNVLLVEAGKVETFAQDVPVMAAYMQGTAFNWGYWAEPQSGSCLGKIFFLI
jgi:choline dehydrogenase-like flavoprotein